MPLSTCGPLQHVLRQSRNAEKKTFRETQSGNWGGIFAGLPPPALGTFAQIWDLDKMEALQEKIGGEVNVTEAWESLLSPDDKHAVIRLGGGQRKTRSLALIDMETGRVSMPEMPRRNTTLKDVAFSPDGNTLTAEDETGAAVSWNVSTGALLP